MSFFTGSKGEGNYFNQEVQVDLAKAVGTGNIDGIRSAVKAGADVNQIGNKGMTPLMWGIVKQNYDGIAELLKQGADPNLTTSAYNAMRMASILKNEKYLRLLIKHGGDVEAKWGDSGRTIMFEAVFHNRINNIKLLIESGANVDHQDISGGTVLHDAVSINAYELAVVLLEHGADPKITDKWGYDVTKMFNQYGEKGLVKGSKNYRFYEQFKKMLAQRSLNTGP